MHATFIPYGIKSAVDKFQKELECQKFRLRVWNDKEEKSIWIEAQLRILPFGVWDFVFPKEYKDIVLTTLDFKNPAYGNDYGFKMKLVKSFFKRFLALKTPKFKEAEKLLWIKDFVSIIPLGIREDRILVETEGEFKGWKHEAI